MFYTTLSVWCYLKYLKQGSIIYVVGIGVFSGIAILNKWLPGLFIFGVWGMPFQFLAKVMKDKKEILIPLNDNFILNIDEKKKLVEVQLPDGFLEIF